MKAPLIALIVLAAGAAGYIVLRAKAPTYAAPVAAEQETIPRALLSEPATGEVVRVFDVEGMCCGGCAPKVFKALTAQPGVRAAAVDYDSHTARAIVPADADVAALERALTFDEYVAKARP